MIRHWAGARWITTEAVTGGPPGERSAMASGRTDDGGSRIHADATAVASGMLWYRGKVGGPLLTALPYAGRRSTALSTGSSANASLMPLSS